MTGRNDNSRAEPSQAAGVMTEFYLVRVSTEDVVFDPATSTGGCRKRAAERLQLSYSTLKFRLRKLAIVDQARSSSKTTYSAG